MTIEEIRKGAPLGATHYFLVPKGSGEPFYVVKIKDKFYYYYGNNDIISKDYILNWIKPLF